MKTKAQKKKAERDKERLQFILKIIGTFFLLLAGFIYLSNRGKDETLSVNGVSDGSLTINTVKNSEGLSSELLKIREVKSDAASSQKTVDASSQETVAASSQKSVDASAQKPEDTIEEGKADSETSDSEAAKAIADEKININTATYAELCKLKGIGPSKAEKIISYRENNGSFSCIEDIMKVPGIKNGIFEKIKDSICAD